MIGGELQQRRLGHIHAHLARAHTQHADSLGCLVEVALDAHDDPVVERDGLEHSVAGSGGARAGRFGALTEHD